MKKSKFILGLLMAAFVLASSMTLYSCYPYGSTNPEEYDVYLTLHKTDLSSYKNYRTYIMRDSVEHLDAGGGTITRAYDPTILSRVAANLQSLGYRRIIDAANIDSADIVVTNAITSSTTYYVESYYPSGYYGYGYGYYYPYSTVYTVSLGTVITTMLDRRVSENGKSPAVWMGILNGVATGDVSTTTARVSDGINRVFSQSPYLKVN